MIQSKLVRVGLLCIILQFVFSDKVYCQTKSDSTAKRNIENTTWSGVDSDGDFYEYTFLEGGRVSYRTNTSRKDTVQFNDDEDVWSQNDSVVIIVLGDTSVQKGMIKNNKMEGIAWNTSGKRWTWTLKPKE